MMSDIAVDVAVIGGGIIGLSIAAEVQRSGRTVVVIDPEPARGATFAAAGMLAPVSELHYQEESLLPLTLASAALWPAFADRLDALVPAAAAGNGGGGHGEEPGEEEPGTPLPRPSCSALMPPTVGR